MRLNWTRMTLGVALVVGLIAAPIAGYAQTSQDVRVDLTLRDADMMAATRLLTAQTGLQFIVEPTEDPFPKITLSLAGVTAEDAIRYLCQAAGAFFKRDDNGVYIISRSKPVRPDSVAPTVPAVPPKLKLAKIKLMKADAEDVYKQIRGIAFDPMRGFLEMNRLGEITDAALNNDYDPGGIFILGPNGEGAPTFTPVGTQSYAQPRTGGESGGSTIQLPGEAGNQFGEGGDVGGGQGFGGGAQGGGQAGGQAGGGAQGGGGLPRGGLIPQGITFLSFDPNDNAIIVQGTDEQIRELQDAIAYFDVAPRQVVVKVEFVTTSNSLNRSLGFEFNYSRGPLFLGPRPGTFARAGDPFFLAYSTGNVSMRVRHLMQEGFGKVVSAPMLRTLNNQPAVVRQTVQTTIFLAQSTAVAGGTVFTTFNPQQYTVNTQLAVRPRINGDGTITMFMNPTIQDFGQIRRAPNGQEIPDRLTQTVQVVARVKSGETIVLGGLTRKTDLGSAQRFPILGDLPIIGQFFRSSTKERNVSELLVFVTPTVIEDDENYGLGP